MFTLARSGRECSATPPPISAGSSPDQCTRTYEATTRIPLMYCAPSTEIPEADHDRQLETLPNYTPRAIQDLLRYHVLDSISVSNGRLQVFVRRDDYGSQTKNPAILFSVWCIDFSGSAGFSDPDFIARRVGIMVKNGTYLRLLGLSEMVVPVKYERMLMTAVRLSIRQQGKTDHVGEKRGRSMSEDTEDRRAKLARKVRSELRSVAEPEDTIGPQPPADLIYDDSAMRNYATCRDTASRSDTCMLPSPAPSAGWIRGEPYEDLMRDPDLEKSRRAFAVAHGIPYYSPEMVCTYFTDTMGSLSGRKGAMLMTAVFHDIVHVCLPHDGFESDPAAQARAEMLARPMQTMEVPIVTLRRMRDICTRTGYPFPPSLAWMMDVLTNTHIPSPRAQSDRWKVFSDAITVVDYSTSPQHPYTAPIPTQTWARIWVHYHGVLSRLCCPNIYPHSRSGVFWDGHAAAQSALIMYSVAKRLGYHT